MNETYTTVVGRVAGEVRQRSTFEGHKVVNFRLASNERRYDREAGQWVDGNSLYLTVTCWRKLAAGVASSLRKGDPVLVTGRLSLREFEYQGQRRTSLELDAQAVGPDLTWCTAEVWRRRRGADIGSTGDESTDRAAESADYLPGAGEEVAGSRAPAGGEPVVAA
ncbi:single-strand DNA-binding protein [Tamaricihabitans halophyticus]|uniref:Single-stranded DNA-binding protein n=1 Tax=Tamaricihabitans halophyticus TaxID=1262583 RepID=A0A4R2QHB7_9PSEU|nr:single-stranded DNA-binding protein [Tamaricihabitans halophyticus]TCP48537.1 single-strand DNA-binding protein [Tamaricihabitans halophyticus]